MALNYDIAIHCVNEVGDNLPDTKIHAYFHKIDSGSSSSIWDGEIRKTAGNGKTSFNLGDNSFLGSEGLIKTGDKILITAWVSDADTSNNDKSSKSINTLTKCINFIHTVDTSSSSWQEDFTVLVIQNPVCDFTIPTVLKTGHEFTITNNSSINQGNFQDPNYSRDDLFQELNHFGEDIFLGLEIEKTNYNLGEVNEDINAIGNYSYSYMDAGDYTDICTVYNFLGFSCHSDKNQHILFNKPSVNFDYTFTKLLNSNKHIGVGNDDELKISQLSTTNYGDTWAQLQATFDWSIGDLKQDGSDNGDTYLDKDEFFEPTKLYLSEGSKNIKLNIKWNDGFDNKVEELILNPFLDIFNISLSYNWTTAKNYKLNGIYIPLGDDDLVKVHNTNSDNAAQDYNSNSQWIELKYDVTKKKNDGSQDNETFLYKQADGDDYLVIPEYLVKFYHINTDKANINMNLIYWDGYKNNTKDLSYDFETQNYVISNDFHWVTDLYGTNKVVTQDDDSVTIYSDTSFVPQNRVQNVTEDKYNILKEKYTSYTDDTIIDDSEEFIYSDLNGEPNFTIGKEGDFTITNTVKYYDGYEDKIVQKEKTILARVHTPNPRFYWESRLGKNKSIEGRDDEVTFTNESTQTDFYDNEKSITSSRNLLIDWIMKNYITSGNYSNIGTIGGDVFSEDNNNIDYFTGVAITDKPTLNYFTELDTQEVSILFYFNDGFFNRDILTNNFIKTISYADLIPNSNYPSTIPDRHTDIIFSDNSTSNENRIISTDWSLSDRYEDNSMSTDKQGQDNLQEFLNINRETEITTTVNSQENHTLSQDEVRWDDGFKLKTFSNLFLISTTKYDVNPGFSHEQIFVTGPEIRFTNTCSVNGNAVQIDYDLEIEDKNNDGSDAFASYSHIHFTDTQDHTYKSVSNSPFEADTANKEVTIFNNFDDGWNLVYDNYTEDILVKPNRISQNFSLSPQRHSEDTETEDNIITGNKPIAFEDASSSLRDNKNFIKSVEYIITEDC